MNHPATHTHKTVSVPKQKRWTRFDTRIFEVQPNLYIKVFWKLARDINHRAIIERLTSLTVHAYDCELVKFDISFDYPSHYHVAPNRNKRYPIEASGHAQCVQEIESILIKNIQGFLEQFPHPDLSSLIVNDELFVKALEAACNQLLFYTNNIDSLIEENQNES